MTVKGLPSLQKIVITGLIDGYFSGEGAAGSEPEQEHGEYSASAGLTCHRAGPCLRYSAVDICLGGTFVRVQHLSPDVTFVRDRHLSGCDICPG